MKTEIPNSPRHIRPTVLVATFFETISHGSVFYLGRPSLSLTPRNPPLYPMDLSGEHGTWHM
jgi:hypothetical protein